MTEFERKLMQLTPEQSRELSKAMNAGYNKRLADKNRKQSLKEQTKIKRTVPKRSDICF